MGNRYDAFLSYRRADVPVARALHALLTAFGHDVFLDVACIPPATSWDRAIAVAASHCNWMVVLWSRNAASSEYMKREWSLVPDGCRLLTVRLDDTPPPPELAHLQAVEGLGAAERILSRTYELLTKEGKTSSEAKELIAAELRSEGVDLTPERQRAMGGYVSRARRGGSALGFGVAAWLLARGARAAVSVGGVSALGVATLAGGFAAGARLQSVPLPFGLDSCGAVTALEQNLSQESTELSKCNDELKHSTSDKAESPGALPKSLEQSFTKLDAENARTAQSLAELKKQIQDIEGRIGAPTSGTPSKPTDTPSKPTDTPSKPTVTDSAQVLQTSPVLFKNANGLRNQSAPLR